MLLIVGIIMVFGSVIVGYLMHHGNLHVLMQANEFVIIGGAAGGSFLMTCTPKILIKTLKLVPSAIIGKSLTKRSYLSLLGLLFSLFSKIKKEGLLAVETDIEDPFKSPLFRKHPDVLKNHHAVDFICDNMRVFVVGIKPMDLEDMMDIEMDAHHDESAIPTTLLTKVADSLPGFGIVAAVLGVVITMGKMDQGPEVIGASVAAALVGTFLGILLSYGAVGPLATFLEIKSQTDSKYLEAIKVSIMAFARDFPPQMAVEAGRRVIFSEAKPGFKELESEIRKKK
jgi:chemotaxis protein MotA